MVRSEQSYRKYILYTVVLPLCGPHDFGRLRSCQKCHLFYNNINRMSCRVVFVLGKDRNVEATLHYGVKAGELYISFVDDDDEELVTDKLSHFATITADDTNPLALRLEGEKLTRELTFLSEEDAANFWEFLQSQARISVLPGEQRSFSIVPEPHEPGVMASILPSAVGVIGRRFLDTTIKTIGQFVGADPAAKPARAAAETDGFVLGNIAQSMSTELQDFTGDVSRLSSIQFTPAQMAQLWCERMGGDRPGEYTSLATQWRTLTQGQWDHAFSLRSFVVAAEAAIKASALSEEPFDRLAFDVMMSLFTFYFMKIQFQSDFVTVLEVIIPILVKASGGKFETHTGKRLEFDEAAEMVFWVFKKFADMFVLEGPKRVVPDAGKLFLVVRSILADISPSTGQMLDDKGVKSLDFCHRDLACLVAHRRDKDAAKLFLTALICADNVALFIEYSICTLLVMLQARLQKIPNDEVEAFRRVYEELVPSVDVRLLLFNVENLLTRPQ